MRDARWGRLERFGAGASFEDREDPFEHLGINIRVLGRGEAIALYHSESVQEDFLVLAGTCTLIIEGEERQLHAWDFVHCPPGTAHTLVGAGDEPCVIVAVGARSEGITYRYPVCEAAVRLGAGRETETDAPAEAYADAGPIVRERPSNSDELPWAGSETLRA